MEINLEKELTDAEKKILKEFAQNLMATSRVGRIFKTALVWIASTIGAGYIVWEFILKAKI